MRSLIAFICVYCMTDFNVDPVNHGKNSLQKVNLNSKFSEEVLNSEEEYQNEIESDSSE